MPPSSPPTTSATVLPVTRSLWKQVMIRSHLFYSFSQIFSFQILLHIPYPQKLECHCTVCSPEATSVMSSEPHTACKRPCHEIQHNIFIFFVSLFLPAPCPPSQVQATLDCDGNRALVSWLSSRLPSSYTASIVDQSGSLLSCSTVNSSCWVPSLKCGQVYDVSVTYHNGICRSKLSAPIRMNSGESRAAICTLWVGFTQNLTGGCRVRVR